MSSIFDAGNVSATPAEALEAAEELGVLGSLAVPL